MLIKRNLTAKITAELKNKNSPITVIYGARQVGKTTLVENILKNSSKNILKINGDRLADQADISSRDFNKLKNLVAGFDILFIDEAQRIPEIGINLKILHDNLPDLKIIVTCSSALDLSSSIKEPLTGRKKQFTLYPISFLELAAEYSERELAQQLEDRLIFGGYPKLGSFAAKHDKIAYITELTEDYLYKDILEIENIRYYHKLRDLLRLLAFQIGSEISLSELGNNLALGKETVARYIDLLEQSFVIFTLRGFSRNLRKEVYKKPKIYFYDLGIRNSILGNFNNLELRNDRGVLWENFLLIERMKKNSYQDKYLNQYFWRIYTGAELDYIEESGGELHGYEFKYSKTSKAPQSWLTAYKNENAKFTCINKDNFLNFITN